MAVGSPSIIDWISEHSEVIRNIANNLIPVQRLVTGAAYLIGLAFAFKAIYSLKIYGESRAMMSSSASIKEPLIYLIVAAIFIYFPTGLDIMLVTAFGREGILQFQDINSPNSALSLFSGPTGEALALIIQVVGVIAFVRGWMLIARSASQGQQPGGTGKGLMHVFGGILAMNIVATLEIINNTLYGS